MSVSTNRYTANSSIPIQDQNPEESKENSEKKGIDKALR